MKMLLIYTATNLLLGVAAHGQLIIADDYNVAGNGTGFDLDTGLNTAINPPATRLTGSAAGDLRYIQTATGKATSAYSITDNKISIPRTPNSGRFTLSADGTTAFDFASALGTGSASASSPAVYDITLSMANSVSATTRFSFGLGTVEDNANFWDFGFQLWHATATDDFYTIQKRIDRVSYTTEIDSSGSLGDINKAITTTAAGTYANELHFLMRVTDAGAEESTFNSRIQLSMDGGSTWFYDTSTDSDLPLGFRLDAAGRYFSWDQAGASSGTGGFTYDNFSVTLVPEPSTLGLGLLGGLATIAFRRRPENR